MRFHIIGSSLKKEGVKKILDLGGDPVRKIDDTLAACISTKGKLASLVYYIEENPTTKEKIRGFLAEGQRKQYAFSNSINKS